MNRSLCPFKRNLSLMLLLLLMHRHSFARCTATTPRSATNAISQSFTGSKFGFSNPIKAMTADNSYATATAIISILSGATENLVLSNFGFSIPANSTVCGIVVEIKKNAINTDVLSTVSDNSIKLVKNGVVSGTNKAVVGNWTTTNAYYTYGSNADLWGLSLTPADVNASNFGIAISANINATIFLFPTVQIDHVQLTIYYQITSLPVTLTEFKVITNQDKVDLHWKAEKEDNFSHYEVERSHDGIQFSKIGQVNTVAFSKEYSFTDASPGEKNFYRLKMIDLDGSFEYSKIASAVVPVKNRLMVMPNPVLEKCILNISGMQKGTYTIEILNNIGQVMERRKARIENDYSVPISATKYVKGYYWVNIYSGRRLVNTAPIIKL